MAARDTPIATEYDRVLNTAVAENLNGVIEKLQEDASIHGFGEAVEAVYELFWWDREDAPETYVIRRALRTYAHNLVTDAHNFDLLPLARQEEINAAFGVDFAERLRVVTETLGGYTAAMKYVIGLELSKVLYSGRHDESDFFNKLRANKTYR